jgi:hypothetical protein
VFQGLTCHCRYRNDHACQWNAATATIKHTQTCTQVYYSSPSRVPEFSAGSPSTDSDRLAVRSPCKARKANSSFSPNSSSTSSACHNIMQVLRSYRQFYLLLPAVVASCFQAQQHSHPSAFRSHCTSRVEQLRGNVLSEQFERIMGKGTAVQEVRDHLNAVVSCT